ncbi:uncharacterized protein LOC144881704 [Branchiostoma floridae x Branchiostoma japonicum]
MDNPAVLLLSEVYGTLKGGISAIYRRLGTILTNRVPDVWVSTAVLDATEDDKDEAKRDGVDLLLPTVHPGDDRTDPCLHWLTFDHRVKYPNLPSNVRSIVGHTNGTSRAACRIKQDRCPDARVVLFIDDIPEDTEQYKGDEEAIGIGKKEDSILKDAEQADVIFSVGDRTFDHFKNQFRAIPVNKRPRHMKFFPRPSKIFEDSDAEYTETETMVVLCIGRVAGVEKLKGFDLAVEALSIVAQKMRVKLRVRGVDKDDIQVTKAILEHCKSANLQITFLPFGTQKDICKDMLQSHLVLMPSRAEPFGLVGLEAIAVGVPVLISDKSGLADLIIKFARRYHNCIVETDTGGDEQRNVGNWARCIERVLRHCEAEFETAANMKRELLSTRYWEESERQFIDICKTGVRKEPGSSSKLRPGRHMHQTVDPGRLKRPRPVAADMSTMTTFSSLGREESGDRKAPREPGTSSQLNSPDRRMCQTSGPSSPKRPRLVAAGMNVKTSHNSLGYEEENEGRKETIEDLIKDNYVLLWKRLQVEKLIPYFIQKRLLDFPDKQVIMSNATTPGRAEALLQLLSDRATCTPEVFVEILKEGDHQNIVDELKKK